MKTDTTNAENRQSIRECLQGLMFHEKKRVLRRADKETLFGFNRNCPLNKLNRIPPKHQKILSDMDRVILAWRFMTLFVVKNEFIEARGYHYFGVLHPGKPKRHAILYRMGSGMNKKLAQYLNLNNERTIS